MYCVFYNLMCNLMFFFEVMCNLLCFLVVFVLTVDFLGWIHPFLNTYVLLVVSNRQIILLTCQLEFLFILSKRPSGQKLYSPNLESNLHFSLRTSIMEVILWSTISNGTLVIEHGEPKKTFHDHAIISERLPRLS